jgi:hypothetical protein
MGFVFWYSYVESDRIMGKNGRRLKNSPFAWFAVDSIPRYRAIHRFADRQRLAESDTGSFAIEAVPCSRRIRILPIFLYGTASRQSGIYVGRRDAGRWVSNLHEFSVLIRFSCNDVDSHQCGSNSRKRYTRILAWRLIALMLETEFKRVVLSERKVRLRFK